MTYNPKTPQPFDLPGADSQLEFLNNFQLLNSTFGFDHIPFANIIENATRAAPCVITSTNHGLQNGDNVTVSTMKGVEDSGTLVSWTINETAFPITIDGPDRFSLDASDTSLLDPYVPNSGSYHVNTAGYPYGYHKKVSFQNTIQDPNLISPRTSLFTKPLEDLFSATREDTIVGKDIRSTSNKVFNKKNQLFFQNGRTESDTVPLTGIELDYEVISISHMTYFFSTPFGLKFNTGFYRALTTGNHVIPLSLPYTTTHYTAILTNFTATGTKRVTALGLTSFTVNIVDLPSTFGDFYYISVGT